MGNEPGPSRAGEGSDAVEIRGVVAARSWIDAIRRCLLVIAAIAAVTSISSATQDPIADNDPTLRAIVALFVLATSVALYLLVGRRPIAGLRAVAIACAITIVACLVASEPSSRHEWRALKRSADSWLFVGSVGVFVVVPYLVARFSRGVTIIGVVAAATVIAFVVAIFGFLDPRFILPLGFTILGLGVMMALRRVTNSWAAIERHPEWFVPPAARSRRVETSTTGPFDAERIRRVPSGIAATYSRWKRLNRPAIRSGGVGGLGLK